MSDNFEFTLHSPLTKEDWNKLSDAELENTMSVTFQTPQGRQVRFIKCEVLDKIKVKIRKKMAFNSFNEGYVLYDDITEVLDEYKAESEEV